MNTLRYNCSLDNERKNIAYYTRRKYIDVYDQRYTGSSRGMCATLISSVDV